MVQNVGLNVDLALKILYSPTPDYILKNYELPYVLTNKQIDNYQENGFIYLPGVLNKESLAFLRRVIQAAVFIRKKEQEWSVHQKKTTPSSFFKSANLCWDFKPVKDFVFGKRFAGLARELLQVKHVRLWSDQALFKEPNAPPTNVHCDSAYWPIKQPQLSATLWLALNPILKGQGCLYFYPQSHRLQKQKDVDNFNEPAPRQVTNGMRPVLLPLNAGDAAFYSGLMYHGTNANKSQQRCESMTITYIADGLRFEASHPASGNFTSCQGLTNGDVINTKFTPILI